MQYCGRLLSSITIFIAILAKCTDSFCLTSCVSDMQCKGFTAVNPLFMCLRGCCSTPNTVIADVRPTADCLQHNIEGFNTSAANAYPWMALIVQTDGTTCWIFNAALVAPNWLAADNFAYNNLQLAGVTTTVYFYIDDPVKRQIYNVSGSETTAPIDIVFLQLQYIGTGDPIAIQPVPVQCNVVNPTQLTLLYWTPITENNLSRIFTSKQVGVLSNADCQAAMVAAGDDERSSSDYYCPDFTVPITATSYYGTPALITDGSGNLQYVGVIGKLLDGAMPIQRISSRAAEMQSVTGAVCA